MIVKLRPPPPQDAYASRARGAPHARQWETEIRAFRNGVERRASAAEIENEENCESGKGS
jgi:hypothetical protein